MTAAPVVIGGLLAATGIVGAVVMFSFTAWHITQRIEETFPAPLTEQLSLSNFNGNVTYEPHDGQDILIEALVRAAAPGKILAERIGRQVSVALTHEEGELRVEGRQRPGWGLLGHAEVNFTVRVPRHWEGAVMVKTSNGSIRARGVQGDSTLHTDNGAIVVSEQNGNVSAQTGNGRIELTQVRGVVNAETSNDDIRIVQSELLGNGRIKTSNGKIVFSGNLTPGAAYDMTTENENVTITLVRPDIAFDIKAVDGEVQLPAGASVSESDTHRVVGRLGDGRARLTVRTSGGSVFIDLERLDDGD